MGLTPEQMEAVKKEAEKYMEANEAFGKAGVALWNARISMAIATEDEEVITKIVKDTDLLTPAWSFNLTCKKKFEPDPEKTEMRK